MQIKHKQYTVSLECEYPRKMKKRFKNFVIAEMYRFTNLKFK